MLGGIEAGEASLLSGGGRDLLFPQAGCEVMAPSPAVVRCHSVKGGGPEAGE